MFERGIYNFYRRIRINCATQIENERNRGKEMREMCVPSCFHRSANIYTNRVHTCVDYYVQNEDKNNLGIQTIANRCH